MKSVKLPVLMVFSVLFLISAVTGAQEPPQNSQAVFLRYKQKKGEVLHADSVVNESVFINGQYSHEAEIVETSVSIVRDVDSDGRALLDTSFRTEERIDILPASREWISSERVLLSRDSSGRMEVPEDAARPVLRNIPVFPEHPVQPGDSWTARAEEVHLFRTGGRSAGPYRGEIPVSYEYAEKYKDGDKKLARIVIRYNIYLPVSRRGEPVRLITGRSEQNLIWDIEAGQPVSKDEEFEFLIMMSDGTLQEFSGGQRVIYRVTMELDREIVAGDLRRSLGDVPGITVDSAEEGVLLSLRDGEAVLFPPESAVISQSQLYRLEALGKLLEAYPDRDILITGHTAHFGSEEGRRELSGERAAAVAGVLFPRGRRGPGLLYLRGAGSDEPTAAEDSEGGRAANRRVEILILD